MITAEFINDIVKFSCDHKKWSHYINSNRLHEDSKALTVGVCFTQPDGKRQVYFSQIVPPTQNNEWDLVTVSETLKIIKETLDIYNEVKHG